jgi:hypothetical protein
MDPRVASILKLAVFAVLALVVFSFGSKHYKKFNRKAALVDEMRTLVSEASFYRSLTEEDARAVLLRGIAKIDEAKSLDLEPTAYFDRVFKREKGKDAPSDEFDDFPAREKLARETLLRAHQHALQLKLLDEPDYRGELAEGRMPDVSPKPVIACTIDPAISPGLEKVVPNLELRPASAKKEAPTDLEIAAARNLAMDLYSAQIIDREAEKRITEHFRPPPPKDEKKK